MEFLGVNLLAVVLAALMGFVVGGIWYGPVMGKQWMGAVGLTEEDIMAGNMKQIWDSLFVQPARVVCPGPYRCHLWSGNGVLDHCDDRIGYCSGLCYPGHWHQLSFLSEKQETVLH